MSSQSSLDQPWEGQSSLLSASVGEESELSTFESILPQEPEQIQMVLPRGMRFAYSSALGGYAKKKKLDQNNSKTYEVTVQPNGRTNMVKEILRYGDTAVPDSGPDFVLKEPPVKFNHAVMDEIVSERHERTIFRRERLQKFSTHRFVPALVSDRLVPCWRSASKVENVNTPAAHAHQRLELVANEMAEANSRFTTANRKYKNSSQRRKYKKQAMMKLNVITPTIAAAMKRSRRVTPEPLGWQIGGSSEAKENLQGAVDAFENGGAGPAWDELREKRLMETRDCRRQWLSHDVIPAGTVPSPAEVESQDVRQSCKPRLQALQAVYAKKRAAFQETGEDRGAYASFEAYCKDHKMKAKQAAEEQARIAAEEEEKKKKECVLAGVLSLGLSKHRATQSDVSIGLGGAMPTDAFP